MKKRLLSRCMSGSIASFAFLILSLALVADARILTHTIRGDVDRIDASASTLTVRNPELCGEARAGFSCRPLGPPEISGSVPHESALSTFRAGDLIIAEYAGGVAERRISWMTGRWFSLAKLRGAGADEHITDIVGDLPTLRVTTLAGGYALEAETIADCNKCSGRLCTAASTRVTVKRGSAVLDEATLLPGGSRNYGDSADGSSLSITFVSGEAEAFGCRAEREGRRSPMLPVGRQPFSVYVVHAE